MPGINLKESICWNCRHSSGTPYDDYVCPWDKEGRAVPGWMRYQRGFIIRCPHFVEEGIWRPDEVFRGKWAKAKGIPYCTQKGYGDVAGRVACLELGVMFPSMTELARYLAESGRIKQKHIPRVRMALVHAIDRNERSGRFQAYGLTFAVIEHDKRRGKWSKDIYEWTRKAEKKNEPNQ